MQTASGVASPLTEGEPLSPREQRVARRLFGALPDRLVVRRPFPASPADVFAAMGRVLPHPPFELQLWDSLDGHPLEGGTMIFRVRPWTGASGLGNQFFFRWRLHAVFVKHLLVDLTPVGQDRTSCQVTVSADLRPEFRVAVRWLPRVAMVGAVIGGSLGALLATMLDRHALLPLAALAGALVGATIARAGLGRAGRTAVGKARLQLEGLLETVGAA